MVGTRPGVVSAARRATWLPPVFHLGLLAVAAGVLLEVFPRVLPHAVASRLGHNSEGFVLALLLALWIQYGRSRLATTERVLGAADGRLRRLDDRDAATAWQWPVTLAVAAACAGGAVFLLLADVPSRFRTLNETFLAAAVLIPYLQVRRPLPARLAGGLSVAVLAVVVLGQRTEVVTLLAETLGVLLLAPVAFDVVDRGILDPSARTSSRLRWAWYAVLALAPVAFAVLEHGIGFGGAAGEATRYAVRTTEAFLCLLLVELYLAVGLGRTGSPQRQGDVRDPVPG